MNSKHLKPWQAEKIFFALEPFARYVHRLRTRMEARGFGTRDGLYRAVLDVQRALAGLQNELITIILKTDEPLAKPVARTTEEYLNSKPPDKRRTKNPPR